MVNSISNKARHVQLNVENPSATKVTKPVAATELAPNAVEAEQEGTSKEGELSAENAKKVIESINQILETTSTKLRYQYHEKLDKYYVTLVDSETEEVVREIPNKKLMDVYAAMLDFVGIFVDEKI